MFTSYFKHPSFTPTDPRLPALGPIDPRLVSIARWSPRWYYGRHYPALGTPKHMMKMCEDEFRRAYQEDILDKLDPRKVFEDLGEDAVLLCWERPGQFCHRRLVANWLEFYLGVKVPELILPLLVMGSQGNLYDAL